MKTLLRGLGYFLLVVLVLVVGVAGYVAYDLYAGANAADLTNTEIEVDGQTLGAYVAQPSGPGPHPAVLLIHEWWGLRPQIINKADALAAEGYVVLAVDAYRGRVATSIPGAIVNTINYPQELIDADMRAFYDYLASLDTVDASRVAVMGFCFGGRQSVIFAVNNPQAAAAVLTYYGGNQPNTEDALAPLSGEAISVLGVFGAEDASIPMEAVDRFEAALAALDVEHEIEVYEGVGHAFVTELSGDSTSAQAWARGLDFLNRTLAG